MLQIRVSSIVSFDRFAYRVSGIASLKDIHPSVGIGNTIFQVSCVSKMQGTLKVPASTLTTTFVLYAAAITTTKIGQPFSLPRISKANCQDTRSGQPPPPTFVFASGYYIKQRLKVMRTGAHNMNTIFLFGKEARAFREPAGLYAQQMSLKLGAKVGAACRGVYNASRNAPRCRNHVPHDKVLHAVRFSNLQQPLDYHYSN